MAIPVRPITLHLTHEEADTLADILGLISGGGRREYATSIADQLRRDYGVRSDYRALDKSGMISFKSLGSEDLS